MNFIASEEIFYRSQDAQTQFCNTPAILQLPENRLLAMFDLAGHEVEKIPENNDGSPQGHYSNFDKVFISDDNGKSWRQTGEFPLMHSRAFVAGKRIYILGHNGYLGIVASDDNGESWSPISALDTERHWHQSSCAVDFRHGKVYLTMEIRRTTTWPDYGIVLMSAKCGDDLTRVENWNFSEPLHLPDCVGENPLPNGVPFLPFGNLTPGRYCGHPGWLESHVLRIYDPAHQLYDPEDRTVIILARCHTGLPNIAAVLKGVEQPDGSLKLETITSPGGAPFIYTYIPGGHMKFFVLYDEKSKLYWMASTQATDSMIRPELLPDDRFGIPDNERHRLALYFSRNLFDWCFAGMVAMGKTPRCARHYTSMTISGEDLLILSRSGDENAYSAHNGNLLTLHRVKSFRDLVY